ncbi:hypothetical protein [Streptomyces sp. NPDC059247]|uniref:hypothetical protein n=1 Tax=Streptomyces sp. NPDC059247 TaxID=3346790 RepID=UPI0036A24616
MGEHRKPEPDLSQGKPPPGNAADQPDQYDFGMTVEESGRRTVWCRDRDSAPWWEAANSSGIVAR